MGVLIKTNKRPKANEIAIKRLLEIDPLLKTAISNPLLQALGSIGYINAECICINHSSSTRQYPNIISYNGIDLGENTIISFDEMWDVKGIETMKDEINSW